MRAESGGGSMGGHGFRGLATVCGVSLVACGGQGPAEPPEGVTDPGAHMVDAFFGRWGLALPAPPLVQRGTAFGGWISTAHADGTVYRVYLAENGVVEWRELDLAVWPAGTHRVMVVAVDRPTTNLSGVVESEWAEAQEAINATHRAYSEGMGLGSPIVEFVNTNLLAELSEVGDPTVPDSVMAFLERRGYGPSDFDVVVSLDLDPERPAGGFAPWGSRFVYMGWFFGAESFGELGLDRLGQIARAVYHHEVGHLWGWEHEWTDCDSGVNACGSFITDPALFGWTDTDGDAIPEILDDTPYGR